MVENIFIAGFDEAGLGPIMGPLVVSGVIVNSNDCKTLKELGVDDSKKFGSTRKSRETRKQILDKSKDFLKYYKYKIISAREIDNGFINGVNMYELEIRAISEILNSSELFQKKVDTIYLHQVGTLKKEKMIKKLKKNGVNENLCDKIIYEKHADKKYIPVSMASIIAKVTRDNHLENISKILREEYISGYPTSTTRKFLEKYLISEEKLSEYIRYTRDWEPLNLLKEKCHNVKDLHLRAK